MSDAPDQSPNLLKFLIESGACVSMAQARRIVATGGERAALRVAAKHALKNLKAERPPEAEEIFEIDLLGRPFGPPEVEPVIRRLARASARGLKKAIGSTTEEEIWETWKGYAACGIFRLYSNGSSSIYCPTLGWHHQTLSSILEKTGDLDN